MGGGDLLSTRFAFKMHKKCDECYLFRENEFTSPGGFTFAVVLAAPSATLPLHVSRKLSGASYVVVVLQGSLKDLLRRN